MTTLSIDFNLELSISPSLLTKSPCCTKKVFSLSSSGAVGGYSTSTSSSLSNNVSYSSNLSSNSCQVPFISTSVTNAGPNSGSAVAKLGQEERWETALVLVSPEFSMNNISAGLTAAMCLHLQQIPLNCSNMMRII